MRIISIINQKGGCGKTTVAINLAAVLARRGYRTLLVDMDPQSHCALGLAVPEQRIERSVADLMLAGLDGSVGVADLVWQVSRGLDLLPSTMALAGIEPRLAQAPDKDRRLAQVLAPAADHYDFCIIDNPPSIGLLTFNALRAADEVLIPVETGYFALQGSVRQAQTIEMLIRRVGHRVRFSVLPTMYDVRTKLAREILSELRRQFGEQVLPLVINFNSKLKEAASFGQPITEYDPGSRGMQDFEELSQWLLQNPPEPPIAVEADPFVEFSHAHETVDEPMSEEFSDSRPAETGTSALSSQARQPMAPVGRAGTHPALSRAAELVERARALSARTAAISARIGRDDDFVAESLPLHAAPHAAPERSEGAGSVANKLHQLYGIRVTAQGVLFLQPGEADANLAIAADFNQWTPARTPLRFDPANRIWQACLPLPPGRYRYRLVVNGEWVRDPYNPTTEQNPYGELNSVIDVVPLAVAV